MPYPMGKASHTELTHCDCCDATTVVCAQMEQLAVGAAKEQAIETKLAAIGAEWAVTLLTFADYKTRGPVILKVHCSDSSAHDNMTRHP